MADTVTIKANGYQGIKGTLIETLPDGSVYVEIQRKGIDLAPRRIRFAASAVKITKPKQQPKPRVKITRGTHKGKLAVVDGTDHLGRYILRVDGVVAPVFASVKSVKAA